MRRPELTVWVRVYPPKSVEQVFSQKSFPLQIRKLILYISNDKEQVDGFVRELTLAQRVYENFLGDKSQGVDSPGLGCSVNCMVQKTLLVSVRSWIILV